MTKIVIVQFSIYNLTNISICFYLYSDSSPSAYHPTNKVGIFLIHSKVSNLVLISVVFNAVDLLNAI